MDPNIVSYQQLLEGIKQIRLQLNLLEAIASVLVQGKPPKQIPGVTDTPSKPVVILPKPQGQLQFPLSKQYLLDLAKSRGCVEEVEAMLGKSKPSKELLQNTYEYLEKMV